MGIKNFTPRLYQQAILGTAARFHTLVALPTGLGKTAISVMLASQRLSQYPGSKIVILAPTRPLIDQHRASFKKYLDCEAESEILSGYVEPEKRKELWDKNQIFFCTPQTLQNDVISGRISLDKVSMLCFDEAHRAAGDYAYVFLAKQYLQQAEFPRILALTASPGSDMDKIKEVVSNLFIEKVEVRTENDKDVRPYIQEVSTEWVEVELPDEFKVVHKHLELCFKSKIEQLKKYSYMQQDTKYLTKKDILKFQAQLQAMIARGERDFEIMKSVSVAAEAIKVEHALELIETQGLSPLLEYFESVYEQSRASKTKAAQNIAKDVNFRTAYLKAKLLDDNIEHPKLGKLKSIVQNEIDNNSGIKILVFSHFRDMAGKIESELKLLDGVNCSIFVGQQKKKGKGMSQKEQLSILDDFRAGKINVLISTSVGEEGLDIPQVDLVIFYEPVPSEIRKIQRQGRTGRLEKGRVIVLLAKDTRDIGYKWAAYHKEKRMYRNLQSLKGDIVPEQHITLDKFVPEERLRIFADTREKGSKIIEFLSDEGFFIDLKRLDIGDYILSKNVAVEFKTKQDFADSIVDGRLLEQIKQLKKSYPKPLIIVEGEEDIYSLRNIHPNAIRGILATIAVSYSIPVLYTKDSQDTAHLLSIIAKREQDESGRDFSPHASKPKTDRELQEYIVSSLPNIGGSLAKELLRNFKTIRQIINADEESLKQIENLGDKKAKEIKRIIEKVYEGI
jgi:Fanconi anemia group M protein